jgi:ornithine cyclodeaminase/alanine dehydrogenase-like protein (mu-crystallin family)
MLLIDNDTATQMLNMADCITALEEAYKEEANGTAVNRTKSQMHVHTDDPDKWYRFSSSEGGLAHAGVVAIRIKSDVLSWPTMFGKVRAYNYCMEPDRYCGLVLLFKTDNGEPLAILNDGVIQHLRVGATAAIAAKHMARPDASVLGILGSGGMAESHLQAYAEVRSLKLAKIYSPNREHRESLAERMQRELPFEILAVEKPELALGKSDIVASCTDAGEAVLFGDWLEDGMHVTIVNHREADEQVYRRISRYIDYQSSHAINLYTSAKSVGHGRSAALARITIGSSPLPARNAFDSRICYSARCRGASPEQKSTCLRAREPGYNLPPWASWPIFDARKPALDVSCHWLGLYKRSETSEIRHQTSPPGSLIHTE